METKLALSWGQRFALINAFEPTDEQIQSTFNISKEDLAAARDCLDSGTFQVDEIFDVQTVGNVFENPNVEIISGAATSAVKIQPAPQRRGRKGDKIVKAFTAIPTSPTPADAFAAEHNVSLAVLRQSKRFDNTRIEGTVRVKKMADGDSKTLMIWRDED